jgi:hypothetical protein
MAKNEVLHPQSVREFFAGVPAIGGCIKMMCVADGNPRRTELCARFLLVDMTGNSRLSRCALPLFLASCELYDR